MATDNLQPSGVEEGPEQVRSRLLAHTIRIINAMSIFILFIRGHPLQPYTTALERVRDILLMRNSVLVDSIGYYMEVIAFAAAADEGTIGRVRDFFLPFHELMEEAQRLIGELDEVVGEFLERLYERVDAEASQ